MNILNFNHFRGGTFPTSCIGNRSGILTFCVYSVLRIINFSDVPDMHEI